MKGISLTKTARLGLRAVLPLSFIIILAFAAPVRGQTGAEQTPSPTPQPVTPQSRVERARSLAVVGNFTAASSELETLRAETNDDAVRDVARILLMSVYLNQGNYTRADGLLEESFKARSPENENTTRFYFALAGQLINGVRSRLGRYREFGLDAVNMELPAEARSDVDQLRVLLERVVDQARTIRDTTQSAQSQSLETVALLEDAAATRLSLARTSGDRTRWQREVAEARQYLVSSQTRLARAAPAKRNAAPSAINTNAANAPKPNPGAMPAATTATTTPDNTSRQPVANTSRGVSANESSKTSTATPAQPPPSAPPSSGSANVGSVGAPLSVGSLVDKATQKVQPAYPQTARNLGVAGVVTVYVVVDANGAVEAVERASGPSLLQRPATDAARRWRFRPTVIEGQPVRVAGYISFNFAL